MKHSIIGYMEIAKIKIWKIQKVLVKMGQEPEHIKGKYYVRNDPIFFGLWLVMGVQMLLQLIMKLLLNNAEIAF